MPLRALLNNSYIFSFNYDEEGWNELKKNPLFMPCCHEKAIQKRSKLGTFFFSHYRKGICTSKPESEDHLFLKNLIAKVAVNEGWEVETEYRGETPDKEIWIADVLCKKGKAKLAFEIQCSPQSYEEFIRRQKNYASSGVRGAWFYKRNKRVASKFGSEIPNEHSTPVFLFELNQNEPNEFVVPQFNETIESFIRGMLNGKLIWVPKKGDTLTANVIATYERCWKCKKETGILLGVEIEDRVGQLCTFERFDNPGILDFLRKQLGREFFLKSKIGDIKMRYSKTVQEVYLSNGCFYCNALFGDFYIFETLAGFGCDLPDPVASFSFIYNGVSPEIEGKWFFNGKPAEIEF